MLVSIPKEKIDSYTVNIRKLTKSSSTTLRGIRFLIGKLQFVVSVITAGRCFILRLINLTVGKCHPAQRIKIDETIREDLRMWLNFLRNYNGKILIQHQLVTDSNTLHLMYIQIAVNQVMEALLVVNIFVDFSRRYGINMTFRYWNCTLFIRCSIHLLGSLPILQLNSIAITWL